MMAGGLGSRSQGGERIQHQRIDQAEPVDVPTGGSSKEHPTQESATTVVRQGARYEMALIAILESTEPSETAHKIAAAALGVTPGSAGPDLSWLQYKKIP